jgi:hypothetical protein
VTPLGIKKLPLVAMADDKGDLSEVDPKNIIMPSLEDLPNDVCQLYEKQNKIHDQEELQVFLARFKRYKVVSRNAPILDSLIISILFPRLKL